MQLVAYGAQDIYLTGNPQITFFKVVYRRHTNFSMESIEQTFNGTADFGDWLYDQSAGLSRFGPALRADEFYRHRGGTAVHQVWPFCG